MTTATARARRRRTFNGVPPDPDESTMGATRTNRNNIDPTVSWDRQMRKKDYPVRLFPMRSSQRNRSNRVRIPPRVEGQYGIHERISWQADAAQRSRTDRRTRPEHKA